MVHHVAFQFSKVCDNHTQLDSAPSLPKMTKMLSIMHQRIRSCVPFSARLVMSDCSFPVVGPVGTLPSPGRTFWLNARSR